MGNKFSDHVTVATTYELLRLAGLCTAPLPLDWRERVGDTISITAADPSLEPGEFTESHSTETLKTGNLQ